MEPLQTNQEINDKLKESINHFQDIDLHMVHSQPGESLDSMTTGLRHCDSSGPRTSGWWLELLRPICTWWMPSWRGRSLMKTYMSRHKWPQAKEEVEALGGCIFEGLYNPSFCGLIGQHLCTFVNTVSMVVIICCYCTKAALVLMWNCKLPILELSTVNTQFINGFLNAS